MAEPSESDPPSATIRFDSLYELQIHLGQMLERDWREFARDKPESVEAARSVGFEREWLRLVEQHQALAPVVQATVKRARRNQEKREAALGEVIRFDRGEPPPSEFPPEATKAVATTAGLRTRRTPRTPGAAETSVDPLPGYHVCEIWSGLTPATYLVKHLLAPSELTVLFGQSGHFKSVVAVDLALSVASGADFHGMRTRQAGVLYVAGEGHAGIRKRLRAWLLARHFDATSPQPALYLTSAGGNLFSNPLQLRSTAEAAAAALGVPIGLVIIDTLAANFGPGDENHASDMAVAIHAARTAAPGAAVLLVHHVGHGQAERERGSYALIGAADCRVQATYDDLAKSIEVRWHKLKDDEKPSPMLFGWKAMPLEWHDEDGQELTSVVVELLDGEARAAATTGPRSAGLGKNQDLALKVLRTLLAKARKNLEERGDDPAKACILLDGWRTALEDRGINRKRYHEVRTDLANRRLIVIDGPHVAPAPSSEVGE